MRLMVSQASAGRFGQEVGSPDAAPSSLLGRNVLIRSAAATMTAPTAVFFDFRLTLSHCGTGSAEQLGTALQKS